jgi:DNA-directed RNA polymerase subunit E'/Rpb7
MAMVFCGTKVSFHPDHQSACLKVIFPVVFRMVVFRPFASEVVIAKVKSSDQESIRRALAIRVNSTILTSRSL